MPSTYFALTLKGIFLTSFHKEKSMFWIPATPLLYAFQNKSKLQLGRMKEEGIKAEGTKGWRGRNRGSNGEGEGAGEHQPQLTDSSHSDLVIMTAFNNKKIDSVGKSLVDFNALASVLSWRDNMHLFNDSFK